MRNQLGNNHFQVQWGGSNIGFMEVSGLGIELDVVAYREGDSPDSTASLMPGQRRYPPVVLKRAIVKGDNEFFAWISGAQFGQVERRDVVISLLDANHTPTMSWRLLHAFPSKLDYAPLNARGSDVAIESLTLAYQGLVVENS